ncbi:carbohydrate ABC transporter permease [Cohnella luojiensis]|uniref:Carbohydrate ABC transporter permease n=1 Tax=Cohnella luojiensis TaxID=652876 RepID=A0A4Y8M6Y0_9BACL|nr:carbohydrate ABC transporter permease [Cohnella luojiensis]TFE30858.1 carbohydrate ABC transporter permease [Cohnella luojiensis]
MVKGMRMDWGRMLFYLLLTAFALLMLAPLVYLASSAFKPTAELFLFPPRFFVMNPTTKNFYQLLLVTGTSFVPFTRYIFNSLIVTTAIVAGGIFISSLAAYPLAKHKMPFRSAIFNMIVFSLMFSPMVLQIPQYLVISRIGLMNTYFAQIIPYLAAPVGMFLMVQFARQIPEALLEAARIDGANEWKVFWVLVLPMLQPAIATFALFSFIQAWNDPYPAMVYSTHEDMKSLPIAIQTISGGAGVVARVGTFAAASFLMIIPTILVFIITQRMVLQTMAHSGLKG